MKNNITKIVLTGGPCAGKTTALGYLQQKLSEKGINVIVSPEIATLLILSGIVPNSIGLSNFEEVVFRNIQSLEKNFEYAAKLFSENERTIIICDRGLPDIGAYIAKKELKKLLNRHHQNYVNISHRYNAVFHLRTAAIGAEKFYTCANNLARGENIEIARELDERTLSAWVGHPKLRIIDNSTSFDKKLKRLYQEVCKSLGIPVPLEIERKFLVEPFSVESIEDQYQEINITQFYLSSLSDDEEVRIRRWEQDGSAIYYKTAKKQVSPGVRIETENQISENDYFENLQYRLLNTRVLMKRRICFVYKNQYFEYDVFQNGACYLEIELTNLNKKVSIPNYINVIKEVTGNSAHSNRQLANV